MKKDIILSGVGGQGILSVAAVIGMAALEGNLDVKQAEVHGMSQRGGAVQSHLRLSSEKIASDLIPYGQADMILSVEPMEALRYLPFLSEDGWIITNTTPFNNITDYPEMDKLMEELNAQKNVVAINAEEIAKSIGNTRASNIVMVGAASPYLDIPFEHLERGIQKIFGGKGEAVVKMNIDALKAGREKAGKSNS
ncbi:MAG: indolepyruvate oxidoreductase subunit beta [Bacteroidetes bacterium]|nr:indolepyruvate oxidoreductase subunit beta [Bacteroidota bacterium]